MITVTGTATDDVSLTGNSISGINGKVAGVKVNGTAVTLSNNTFSANVTLTAGANTLTVVATDQADRTATVTRTVSYDAAPPQLTVTAPGDNSTVTSATLAVTGTVTDDTGVTGVTVNGIAATLSSNTFTANVTLSAGVNTLTIVATDKGARKTTVTRTVTYDATPLQVTINNPVSGAVLDSDSTLVSGTFNGPSNTGVTVNGIVAETSGTQFYANNVPLLAGANTLTATATTASGATATQSITITNTGKAPTFQVDADPQSGIAPLKVKFTVTPNTTAAIAKIEADYDGNGVIDFTTSGPNAPIEYTYSTPGVYQAKLTVTDNQNLSYTQTLVIVVYDAVQMDQKLSALWSGMNAALIAKDVPKALSHLNAQAKTKYGPVFNALLPNMPEIIASYSLLQRVSISSDIGEYAINRTVDGVNRIYFVYFLRDPDGVWRLDAM